MPASAISVTGQIFKVQESPSILPLDDDGGGDYDYYDDSKTKMRTPSQRQQQSGHYESGMATTSPPPDYGTPETQGMSPMENDPDLEEPGRIISNRSGSRPPSNPEERLPSNLHSKFENVTKKSAPPIDTKQRKVMENQSDDSNDTNNKEDSKGAPRRSRRPNFYIGAAVAIFVIAIVTVVSVLLTSDLRDDGTTILDPDELELVPTSPVSPAPTIHLTPTSSPALTSPTTATETPVSPSASPIGTASPTESPTTVAPTAAPVATPTVSPTAFPTSSPTTSPTGAPTALPTSAPLALPTATPTSHPTFSPTTAPVVSNVPAMQTALLDILFVNNVEVNDPAVSPNSPSALAVSWLAEEASFNGGSWFSDDQSKLIQRFAVLTLDYSLQGSSAVSSARSANVYAAMDANADYSGGSGFSDPFDRHHRNLQTTLSATMFQNECSWDGIVCNDLGYVSEIRMGSRSLAGEIPSQIGLLSSLVYLDLAQNDLTGRIPESLYDIPYLRKVYLYQNELTGTISNAIGNLRNLTNFHVSHNSLTGTIPNTMKSDTEIRPYCKLIMSKTS